MKNAHCIKNKVECVLQSVSFLFCRVCRFFFFAQLAVLRIRVLYKLASFLFQHHSVTMGRVIENEENEENDSELEFQKRVYENHYRVVENKPKSEFPKQIYENHYIYSDVFSIKLLVKTGLKNRVDDIAYDHIRRQYQHKDEVEIYNDIAKRDPYPSLEEVLQETYQIAVNDSRFRKFFKTLELSDADEKQIIDQANAAYKKCWLYMTNNVIETEHLVVRRGNGFSMMNGSCTLDGTVPIKVDLVPKTIKDGYPMYYIYSDEYSIQLRVPQRGSYSGQVVYGHIRSKYKHKTEYTIYNEIAKRDPYPTLEEVIAEVKPIADNDECFRQLFEEYEQPFSLELVCADDPAEKEKIKKKIISVADFIYKECPLYENQ